jgi:hypothetical protein
VCRGPRWSHRGRDGSPRGTVPGGGQPPQRMLTLGGPSGPPPLYNSFPDFSFGRFPAKGSEAFFFGILDSAEFTSRGKPSYRALLTPLLGSRNQRLRVTARPRRTPWAVRLAFHPYATRYSHPGGHHSPFSASLWATGPICSPACPRAVREEHCSPLQKQHIDWPAHARVRVGLAFHPYATLGLHSFCTSAEENRVAGITSSNHLSGRASGVGRVPHALRAWGLPSGLGSPLQKQHIDWPARARVRVGLAFHPYATLGLHSFCTSEEEKPSCWNYRCRWHQTWPTSPLLIEECDSVPVLAGPARRVPPALSGPRHASAAWVSLLAELSCVLPRAVPRGARTQSAVLALDAADRSTHPPGGRRPSRPSAQAGPWSSMHRTAPISVFDTCTTPVSRSLLCV